MHIIVKLMLYYSSIVKVTDAHIPVYTSHARTLWMNQMCIHTLLVYLFLTAKINDLPMRAKFTLIHVYSEKGGGGRPPYKILIIHSESINTRWSICNTELVIRYI